MSRFWGLGDIPAVGSHRAMVYGPPGGGKSTFMLRVASHLSDQGHTVVFVGAEEAFGESMRGKLRRLEIASERILITEAGVSRDVLALVQDRQADWVMLDSYTSASWNLPDLMLFTESKVSWLVSCHVNAEGDPYAARAIAHLADQVLKIEAGKYTFEKNRFGSLGSGVVFEMEVTE